MVLDGISSNAAEGVFLPPKPVQIVVTFNTSTLLYNLILMSADETILRRELVLKVDVVEFVEKYLELLR